MINIYRILIRRIGIHGKRHQISKQKLFKWCHEQGIGQ
jgi:hypothetical protein